MAFFDKTEGDGEVLADGAKYICRRWSNIRCIDVKNSGYMFNHKNIVKNPYVVDLVLKAAIDAAFSVRGRLNEVAPYVQVIPFTNFYIDRSSVRQRSISTDL